MKKIEILGLQSISEIEAGDNLAEIIAECSENEGVGIEDKDVIVLTSLFQSNRAC